MFSKDTVENYRELSIKTLKRSGVLRPGFCGTLRWTSSRTGEEKASIVVACKTGHLVLSYRCRSYGHDWEDVKDIIPLAQTQPNYGGIRYWLVCPSCHTRRTALYGGKLYRCRDCRNLCYESQLETGWSAIMSRIYKIRHRLGDYQGLDHDFPSKPKGMRWKTYNALYERYEHHNAMLTMHWMKRLKVGEGLF